VEHLVPLVAYQAYGEALAELMAIIVREDIPQKIVDLLSSATLVILLKKNAATMATMKEYLDFAYVNPQRPLGMGSNAVKIASISADLILCGSLGAVVGPSQFLAETKGRCDLIQWAL